LRYYSKCSEISRDPDADADKKRIAAEYVRCVHRTKIAALDRIVESASPNDKAAFLEAHARCPEVAASDEAKLDFLRCEDFVEAKAAERMMTYWKARKTFFGPEIFHRRIRLRDMEAHILDLRHFRFLQLMQEPDGHGRAVIGVFYSSLIGEGWTEESVAKYCFYIMEAAFERETCRLNGVVLLDNHRQSTDNSLQKIKRYRKIVRAVITSYTPVRVRALHIFLRPGSWWQHLAARLVNSVGGSFFFSRAVIHADSDEENVSLLEGQFNIPRCLIPAELGGSATCDDWDSWVEARMGNDL